MFYLSTVFIFLIFLIFYFNRGRLTSLKKSATIFRVMIIQRPEEVLATTDLLFHQHRVAGMKVVIKIEQMRSTTANWIG